MTAAPSMAEVLAKHEARWTTYGYERPYQRMHCASADCDWSLRQKVSMSDDECYAIHRAHVAQALAAAGFGHVASELQEVLMAALGKSVSTDMMKAYLLDAADRLGDPSHRGNRHAWPEHARMMRALAATLDGEGGR